MIQSHAIWTYVKPTVNGKLVTPFGESLGSSAEEGRVKLRKAPGRCKKPMIR